MLEHTPTIQNYLRILEKMKEIGKVVDQQVPTEEDFFDNLTKDYFYGEKNTNRIYVYMGTFANSSDIDIVHGASVSRIPRDSFKEEGWNEYKDVERHYSEAVINIPRKETEEFERDNIVLFAPLGSDEEVFYKIVRKIFFQHVVAFGQEEAVERIIEQFGTPEQNVKRERNKKE